MWVRVRISGVLAASEPGGTSANIIWFFLITKTPMMMPPARTKELQLCMRRVREVISVGGFGTFGDCLDAVECFAQYRQRVVKDMLRLVDALFPALMLPRDRAITA
jgi:hypothetical protein